MNKKEGVSKVGTLSFFCALTGESVGSGGFFFRRVNPSVQVVFSSDG
jgi:hypothetical protein